MPMRLNHMELTFAEGALTPAKKQQITDFYRDLFGWNTLEIDIMDQKALLLMLDEDVSQFILLAESPEPMQSPGYDHLGLLFDSREEVDALLAKAKAMQAVNNEIQIKEYEDLDEGGTIVHSFYVRHLLPIWFDVQSIDYQNGEPARKWHYG
ncbi:VOC family protein [Litorivivens sp.]|uniref:VOC family protein n=2 Tax=Litorivivens sp. TaxID=2020868 RepID=UPI003568F965